MPARPKTPRTVAEHARRGRHLEAVEAVLQDIADEVARLPDRSLADLAPILAQAEHEVAIDLTHALAKVGGDTLFTTQAYRNVLVQLRASLATVKRIEPQLFTTLANSITPVGRMAARHVKHELATFSQIFTGTVRPIEINLASIVSTAEASLIPRFRTAAARYAGQVGLDIKRQLAVGVVRGETFGQMAQRLVRLGGPKGNVALAGVQGDPGAYVENIAEGLFTRYEHWADRLVRTELVEGYNVLADEGIREVAQIDDEICRRWDATNDWRRCPFCGDLDDVIVGVDQMFPGGVDHPPLHPRCRCFVVAWRRDWHEARGTKTPLGKPARARQKTPPS